MAGEGLGSLWWHPSAGGELTRCWGAGNGMGWEELWGSYKVSAGSHHCCQ